MPKPEIKMVWALIVKLGYEGAPTFLNASMMALARSRRRSVFTMRASPLGSTRRELPQLQH
jgi:hypothetical protein